MLKKTSKEKVIEIIERMQMRGIKSVVLGCTELLLVIKQNDVDVKVYNTLQVLVEAAVDYSYNQNTLKHH